MHIDQRIPLINTKSMYGVRVHFIYMVPFLEASEANLPVPAAGLCLPLSTLGHYIHPVKKVCAGKYIDRMDFAN